MGGGDLNMKKHFHPLTMQNLERVWKAEQKAKDEAQKLEQLQKELEEERRREALQQHAVEQGIIKKKGQKLDWMYAGPQVNHEEYLLGRKIDKNVEVLKEEEKKEDKEIGSSFVPDIADPVKDMAAKIKEDPLFLIRKKEDESRKELVKNPIKLRKLKEMLNLSVKEKKKHKKSKKNKKEKRKNEKEQQKRRYDSGDDLDGESENERRRGSSSNGRYHTSERKREDRIDHKRRRSGDRSQQTRKRYDSEGSSGLESDDSERDIKMEKKARMKHREKNGTSWTTERRDEGRMKPTRRRERSVSSGSDDSGEDRSRSRGLMKTETRGPKYHERRRGERDRNGDFGKEPQSRRRDEHDVERSSFGRSDKKNDFGKETRRNKRYISSDEEDECRRKKSKNSRIINDDESFASRDAGTRMQNGREYGLVHPKGKRAIRDLNASSKENGGLTSRKGSSSQARHYSSPDSSPDRRHSSKQRSKRESDSDSDNKYKRNKAMKPPARMISSNLSKKLTAEELEKKRLEMMENAKWRDDQRGKNVQKYKLEDEKEEKEVRSRGTGSDEKAKFIHDLQVKSYSSSSTASVEDRIKRNIYTKQRTQSALNKKFTEK